MSGSRPVSESIWQKIQALAPKPFQVGVAKDFKISDLEEGALQKLGVQVVAGSVEVQSRIVPPEEAGRWSAQNVNGLEVVRKDLPKVPRPVVGWVYPYGNKNASKVPAFRMLKAYPRETLHGQGHAVLIDAGAAGDETIRLGVRVDRVFPSDVKRDNTDLRLALSLLKELVGTADVIAADTDHETWTKHQQLSWEILPQGRRVGDEVFSAIQDRLKLSPSSDMGSRGQDPKRNDLAAEAQRGCDRFGSLQQVRGLHLQRRSGGTREHNIRKCSIRDVRELACLEPAQPP